MTNEARNVKVGRDALGNILVTGDGNLVIIQTTRTIDTEVRSPNLRIGPNPYKGLAAFLEKDANNFFGRETLIQSLRDKFRLLTESQPSARSARILPIIGASGSGKSSVVRAGLIPELAKRPIFGWESAQIIICTPGAHPLESLASALARVTPGDELAVTKTRTLNEELKVRNERGEFDGLRRIIDTIPNISTSRLIIFIDQFEELYSLSSNKEDQNVFTANLLSAACDPSFHCSVILTLRADFIGETNRYEEFSHVIAAKSIIVPVMKTEELRQAIAGPAKQNGHPLDDSVVDLLISESRNREGVLPLLQFALTRIWEGMELGVAPATTLRKIGGVGGALAAGAQRLYDELSDETDKEIARRAFLSLVRIGVDIPTTRRTLPLREIVAHDEDKHRVKEILNRFAAPGARIITLFAEDDLGKRECAGRLESTEKARISHEALLEHWVQLNNWITAERDNLLFKYRLEDAVNYWNARGRAKGLLWRSPDLYSLKEFYKNHGGTLTTLQMEFFKLSMRAERLKWIIWAAGSSLIAAIFVASTLAFYYSRPSIIGNSNSNSQNRITVANQNENITGDEGETYPPPPNATVVRLEGDNNGIDVSQYHEGIDWDQLRSAGVKFAFIRATNGISKQDKSFSVNWQKAKQAGVLRGAYHSFNPWEDVSQQAKNFIETVGFEYDGELPPVVDVYSNNEKLRASDNNADKIRAFLTEIENQTHRKPIILADTKSWNKYVNADFSDYPLWVSSPSFNKHPVLPKGWKDWTFQQYNQLALLPGVTSVIDLNKFNGTYQDLLSFAKL